MERIKLDMAVTECPAVSINVPTKYRATGSKGQLTKAESSSLDRCLRLLHSELRTFLSAMPVEAQSASGLARFLETERTSCQRVVAAVTRPYPGLELVGQLPGPKGLQGLVQAARERDSGPRPSDLDRVSAVTADYNRIVHILAGSRTRLLARLEHEFGIHPVGSRDGDAAAREALYDAAAAVTGRQSELWFATRVFEPVPGRNDVVQQTRAHGLIGHRAVADAVPLCFHDCAEWCSTSDDPQEPGVSRPLFQEYESDQPNSLLHSFSSQPVPIIRSQQPDEFLVQRIECSPSGDEDQAIDLVFGMTGATAHPDAQEIPRQELWALVNFPARKMLLDVYMHRELATRCLPSIGVHLWQPYVNESVGERWQTQFSNPPRLELLGDCPPGARFDHWDRYEELCSTLFDARGLSHRDFVGFRCEVDYPIWRAGYLIAFDFGSPHG